MFSVFSFLQDAHEDLGNLAIQGELTVWSNPRSTLMQGRLYGEEMATYVAKLEQIEPVYAIKQYERLNKLFLKGLISEQIRGNFEWLRMNGNAAAHDSRNIPVDLALTAHRQMFELAVWFVESYGAVTIEIPSYVMPVQKAMEPVVEVRDQENSNLATGEHLEKLLNAQIETKLLPTLDERFQELQESLLKFAGNLNQWSRPNLTITDNEADANLDKRMEQDNQHIEEIDEALPPIDEGAVEQKQTIEIAAYLESKSYQIIDKRDKGGTLWVLGGWELNKELVPLKKHGLNFRFARKGGQSTKRKPAWFLSGNDPSVKYWLPLELTEQPIAADDNNEYMRNDTDIHASEAASVSHQEVISTAQQEASASVDVNLAEGVSVPDALRLVRLDYYAPCQLTESGQSLGITYLGEWTEDKLRELYRNQPNKLHDIMVQLWFLGFQFQGQLARFIKLNSRETEDKLSGIVSGIELAGVLPLDSVRLLQRFGITASEHLNEIPLSSLEWLLRERYEDTLALIKAFEPLHVEREELVNPEQVSNLDEIQISYQDRSVSIPVKMMDMPIALLDIKGCPAVLRGLNELKIRLIKQLPSDLLTLAEYMRGVGARAIEKFYEQLLVHVQQLSDGGTVESPSILPSNYKSQTVAESGCLVWQDKHVDVSADDCLMPLFIEEYPKSPRLINLLHESSVMQLGQLPASLDQLGKYSGIGVGAINKFFDQLLSALNQYRQKQQFESVWQQMTAVERLDQTVGNLRTRWTMKFSESEIQDNRNMQMIHYRWSEQREGRKTTLESLGQVYNLTRERVRQIIKKVLHNLSSETLEVERALREALSEEGEFFDYPMDVSHSFADDLCIQVLQERGLLYMEEYEYWTMQSEEQMEAIINQITKNIQLEWRACLLSDNQLDQHMTELSEQLSIPKDLAIRIAKQHLQPTETGHYILSGTKKYEVVEMVLGQYPEGVEIYKRVDELLEQAKKIMPDQFDRDREITTILNREDTIAYAYLWGRGVYIHPKFVHNDQELMDTISSRAIQLLEYHSPISVGRLFKMFNEELLAANIPNEYALYTMLRKWGDKQLSLQKFPHIWREDDAFKLTNGEQIKMYLREQQQALSLDSLREEFIVKRGWKPFTLNFSISSDPDFINVDLGVIGLREFFPYQSEDFMPVLNVLSTLLEQIEVVHVNRLLDEMSSYCERMGITTGYLLYDLLQGMKDSRFIFMRYPLIASAKGVLKEITLQSVIEQFIRDHEAEVPREVVFQWLTEDVGAKQETLDLILGKSSDIFYYTSGQYGEYIHRERLAWTAEKEVDLISLVTQHLNEKAEEGIYYVTVKELWKPDQFPSLMNSLPWTEDLFIDCLRKSGHFRFIGSYDHIIVSVDHQVIVDETSWIAHVLKREYGGKVPLPVLQNELKDLKYSQDGKFLYETSTRLEQGNSPFVIMHNEAILQ